jgi:long-chain acyl-CoA synthetase
MAFQFETLVEMQHKAVQTYGDKPLFGTRNGDKYEWTSYAEFGNMVDKTRTALQQLGIKQDGRVAIISNNRIEWAVLSYATMSLGAQMIPMYEAQQEQDWKFIIEDSGATLVVGATEAIHNVIKHYPGKVGKVQNTLSLDKNVAKEHNFHGLVAAASPSPVPDLGLNEDSLATIIYTSGTTGKPKGVELTHGNIVSDVIGGHYLNKEELHADHTSLAFLPWAHVYGLTLELNTMVSAGKAMAIVPHRDQLLECLQMAKPTVILSVPILFNRIYDGIMKNVAAGSAAKRSIFNAALHIARKRNALLEQGQSVGPILAVQHQIADKVVLSKIRERLGGRIRFMGSGGAAVDIEVLRFFEDIGIPIPEGYGLTETAPMVSASSVGWTNRRIGAVGVPLPYQTIRIADPETLEPMPPGETGEVCCAGPNIMRGYHNRPGATEEVIFYRDGKRFFRTGDMGRIVDGRFLQITGRIKEQFKLENGKYVVPTPLEDKLGRGPFVLQCFLYGANKPSCVMLLVPNIVELKAWAGAAANKDKALAKKLESITALPGPNVSKAEAEETMKAVYEDEDFVQLVTAELQRHGAKVKHYERPTAWLPLAQAFLPENEMLTPKLSLRRPNVLKVHQASIDAMYQGKIGHRVAYAHTDKSE